MVKYECSLCGYVYDPAEGDEAADIEPGTAFEKLPDDWVPPTRTIASCGCGLIRESQGL